MDPHEREYIGAVAGMRQTYGEVEDHEPAVSHDDGVSATEPDREMSGGAGSMWEA